jgi:hypothetical protein
MTGGDHKARRLHNEVGMRSGAGADPPWLGASVLGPCAAGVVVRQIDRESGVKFDIQPGLVRFSIHCPHGWRNPFVWTSMGAGSRLDQGGPDTGR